MFGWFLLLIFARTSQGYLAVTSYGIVPVTNETTPSHVWSEGIPSISFEISAKLNYTPGDNHTYEWCFNMGSFTFYILRASPLGYCDGSLYPTLFSLNLTVTTHTCRGNLNVDVTFFNPSSASIDRNLSFGLTPKCLDYMAPPVRFKDCQLPTTALGVKYPIPRYVYGTQAKVACAPYLTFFRDNKGTLHATAGYVDLTCGPNAKWLQGDVICPKELYNVGTYGKEVDVDFNQSLVLYCSNTNYTYVTLSFGANLYKDPKIAWVNVTHSEVNIRKIAKCLWEDQTGTVVATSNPIAVNFAINFQQTFNASFGDSPTYVIQLNMTSANITYNEVSITNPIGENKYFVLEDIRVEFVLYREGRPVRTFYIRVGKYGKQEVVLTIIKISSTDIGSYTLQINHPSLPTKTIHFHVDLVIHVTVNDVITIISVVSSLLFLGVVIGLTIHVCKIKEKYTVVRHPSTGNTDDVFLPSISGSKPIPIVDVDALSQRSTIISSMGTVKMQEDNYEWEREHLERGSTRRAFSYSSMAALRSPHYIEPNNASFPYENSSSLRTTPAAPDVGCLQSDGYLKPINVPESEYVYITQGTRSEEARYENEVFSRTHSYQESGEDQNQYVSLS